jgi:hypothetical protein
MIPVKRPRYRAYRTNRKSVQRSGDKAFRTNLRLEYIQNMAFRTNRIPLQRSDTKPKVKNRKQSFYV